MHTARLKGLHAGQWQKKGLTGPVFLAVMADLGQFFKGFEIVSDTTTWYNKFGFTLKKHLGRHCNLYDGIVSWDGNLLVYGNYVIKRIIVQKPHHLKPNTIYSIYKHRMREMVEEHQKEKNASKKANWIMYVIRQTTEIHQILVLVRPCLRLL